MKDFIKFTFASILGICISFILICLFFIIFLGSIIASGDKKTIKNIQPNSILYITLDKTISERTKENPFGEMQLGLLAPETTMGLNDILKSIREAGKDNKIKGIYMEISIIPAGRAALDEIRNSLLEFKKTGKFILCYSDIFSQNAYYLATAADKIYINPKGIIEFKGLYGNRTYYTGTLEKLGIGVEVFKGTNNNFKSAVEPYLYKKISSSDSLQLTETLHSLWGHYLKEISKSRGISIAILDSIADSLLVRTPETALKYKFVDEIMYKDEVFESLKKLAGIDKKAELNLIPINKYKNTFTDNPELEFIKDKIVVVYATGTIGFSLNGEEEIDADKTSRDIREARLDSSVKAIVIRINSPGGSALASEIIWREIYLAKQVKPVVVSMSDMAASGGYYIACAADSIVSEPSTITGSIGVFGMIFNFDTFLADKLGITSDGIGTNKYSDLLSMKRPLYPLEKTIFQGLIDDIYDAFISHVSEGRKMTKEEVHSIAQGRIWTGLQAKQIGLVDKIGNLDTAINIASKMAKLSKYRLIELPKQIPLIEQIIKDMSGEYESRAIRQELGETWEYYKQIKNIMRSEGAQTRLPYNFTIE